VPVTPYPGAEDYIRAVQEPQRVFRLPALRAAAFELHPVFGIPMPASGNAAVVFRAGVGGADTALRFYIREDASSRERYTALGRHFADRGITACVASAAWVDDAIWVNGSSWPVVQMSWVDGRTLDAYVGHLAGTGNAAALSQLAGTWRGFVGRLQAAEYAHGDLQHGNVLIDRSGALRLVDFDGSWIAEVGGGPPPRETGHPNYQRTGREWGRWMDTFPGLVIYTALLALSRRPDYWAELQNGENILFSAEDFQPPFQTRTWEFLSGIGDPQVQHTAQLLKLACDSAWRADGSLEALLTARLSITIPDRPEPAAPPAFPGVGPNAGGTPWWQLTAVAADRPDPAAAGVPAALPRPRGPLLPPPPTKTAPGATPPAAPSFTQPGAAGAWYQRPGSPAASPPRPPAPRGGRPTRAVALLALAAAALTALLAGGIVAAAGGNGAAAAAVAALIAAISTVRLLRRRR
jgi:hypothetical protein